MSFKESMEKFASNAEHQTKLFGTALLRESLQHPVNGVIELAGHMSNHKLPELHLVDEKGPKEGMADAIGGMAGKTIDFLLLNKLAKGKLAPDAGMSNYEIFSKGFTYGAVSGGVFTPVDSDGPDFWSKRFNNAVFGGTAFGVGSLAGVRASKRFDPKGSTTTVSTEVGSLLSYDTVRALSHQSDKYDSPYRETTLPLTPLVKATAIEAKTPALTAAVLPDLDKISGFALPGESNIDGTTVRPGVVQVSAKSDSTSANATKPIPAERIGLNGTFDQSGLAKRVDHVFEEMGENKHRTIWVAQSGNGVVLEGKTHDKHALAEMISTAKQAGLALSVDDRVKFV